MFSATGNFKYNSMLASALAQLLPAQERKVIRSWIDKLHNIAEGNQVVLRNDYMWFLLLTLKNRRVTAPFNSMPTDEELIPLKDLLPKSVYNNVVNQGVGEANLAWVDQVMSSGGMADDGGEPQPPGGRSVPPSQFLHNQPRPQRGVICYMGAFSDQQK